MMVASLICFVHVTRDLINASTASDIPRKRDGGGGGGGAFGGVGVDLCSLAIVISDGS